jgi:hypothetical protein
VNGVEALIVVVATIAIYRACLTVTLYPVRFWDLRRWW